MSVSTPHKRRFSPFIIISCLALTLGLLWLLGAVPLPTAQAGLLARHLIAPSPVGIDPVSNVLEVPVDNNISITSDEAISLTSVNTDLIRPGLEVSLVGCPQTFCPGWNLYYTFELTNTWQISLTNLVISDTLPADTCCPANGAGTALPLTYNEGANIVTWGMSVVGPGETVHLELVLHSFSTLRTGEIVTNTFCYIADQLLVQNAGEIVPNTFLYIPNQPLVPNERSVGLVVDEALCPPEETATPTPTMTPTPTATATATPTITPTPSMTPRPPGFFCLPLIITGGP